MRNNINLALFTLVFLPAMDFAGAAPGERVSRELARSSGTAVQSDATAQNEALELARRLVPGGQEFQLLVTEFRDGNQNRDRKIGPNSLCQIMAGEDEHGKFIARGMVYSVDWVDAKGKTIGAQSSGPSSPVQRLRLPNPDGSRRWDSPVQPSATTLKQGEPGWYTLRVDFTSSSGLGVEIWEYQMASDLSSVSAIRRRVYSGLTSRNDYLSAKPSFEIECGGAGS